MTVLDQLKQVVMETLGVEEDEITPTASFVEDLGADSLALIELVIAVEEKFHISIPDEDAEKVITVQHAINYLEDKGVIHE